MQDVRPWICRQLHADQTLADSHWREAIQVQDMSAEVLTVGEFESTHARARTRQRVRNCATKLRVEPGNRLFSSFKMTLKLQYLSL